MHKSNIPGKLVCSLLLILLAMLGFITVLFKGDSYFTVQGNKFFSIRKLSTTVSSVTSLLGSKSTATAIGVTGSEAASNISLDADGWYTDLAGQKADKSNFVDVMGFKGYKGLPWDANSQTFFFNSYKAKLDLWDYLDKLGAPHLTGDYQTTREFTMNNSMTRSSSTVTSIARRCPHGYTASGIMYGAVDNEQCLFLGPYPAGISKTYYSSGNWTKGAWAGITYNWQTWKGCAVFVEKGKSPTDPQNYLYVPCIAGDAKGHTYPWGVTQTTMSISSNTHIAWPASSGRNPQNDWSQGINLTDAGSESDILKACSAFKYGNTNVFSYLYQTLEINGISNAQFSAFRSKFTHVGYVSYGF